MNRFIILGRYRDGSGISDVVYDGTELAENAEQIADWLNAGDYTHMQWVVRPVQYLRVPDPIITTEGAA